MSISKLPCSKTSVFTLWCWHLEQTQNNRWQGDGNCFPFKNSVTYTTQLCTNGYRSPCTGSFISYPCICAFIICTNKASSGILSEVKLLPLIIKHCSTLLNANDHIKWKNNIEGWQPEHLPKLIPEYHNHLPWKYCCKIFFLLSLYRMIKSMFNYSGYYRVLNRLLRKRKKTYLRKLKVQEKSSGTQLGV